MKFDAARFSQAARDLETAVRFMRFRITEPTFFLHEERKVGEIMEARIGPYRYEATGGGLKRIAQFEELKEASAMSDPIVPPAVTLAPPAVKATPAAVKKTITGASLLGDEFKARIAAAKASVTAAKDQIASAVDNIGAAANRATTIAAAIQSEADDLNASIGQVSNE
jgi:hypothetical protein